MKVAQFVKSRAIVTPTVHPRESIRSVTQTLRQLATGAAIVSDGETSLDAIVTERDIITGLAARGEQVLDLPVSALATTAAATCSTDTSMTDVANQMMARRISHLPVMSGGRLIVIIDIVDVLAERVEERRRASRALLAFIPVG